MSSETPSLIPSVPSIDPYKLLEITPNPDGSITRSPRWSAATPAAPDSNPTSPILSKDIPISPSNNTFLRLFLPCSALKDSARTSKKLPLIIYFHGGGFILGSVHNPLFHEYCSEVSTEIPAIVVSVGYRLAPEHRLPAAYDDAMEAIHFLRTAREDWLTKYADLSSCFLMGSSAGANIAYHVGLRLADPLDDDLSPLKIRGLVLCQPFFGGTEETGSEQRVVNDPILRRGVCDLMWKLALPTGAGRDHGYCNPMMNGGLDVLGSKIRATGWKYLVTGCSGDPLVDRQMAVSDLIEREGILLERCFLEGGFHGADILDLAFKRDTLCMVRKFISSTT